MKILYHIDARNNWTKCCDHLGVLFILTRVWLHNCLDYCEALGFILSFQPFVVWFCEYKSET